ncbi:hypothetical protein [Thalassiella azotivora]
MNTTEVLLHWLPLGAGGHVVRRNGRAYERLVARREHRPPADLYHCALTTRVDDVAHVLEVAPAWGGSAVVAGVDRGAVVTGPVGFRSLGRSVLFRYEVRCWRDGVVPDLDAQVGPPVRLDDDPDRARRLLALAPTVPALTWGRDETRTGEMWNSNSVVAWLLARAGYPVADLAPPRGGRAPGWGAGVALAGRCLPAGRLTRRHSLVPAC